jgi:hypothetical protein
MHHLVAAILLSLFSVSALAASNVADLVSRYRSATLGEAKQVSNLEYAVGHAKLTVVSGIAAPVMAGEEQVGVFIQGTGSFRYETTNADEFAAVRYNAKNARVKLQSSADKLTVEEPVRSVLLLGSALPAIEGSPATAPTSEFGRNRGLFERQFDRAPFEHLLAFHALDTPAAKVVRAQIDGEDHQLIYTLDEAYGRTERLQRLWKLAGTTAKLKSALFTTDLSEQGAGRKSREEAPARVTLTHLDVDLTASEGNDAAMKVKEKLVAQRPVNVLRFDLHSEYWFDETREPRRYHVRSVTDAAGNALSFVHANDELLVGLASPAAKGQPIELAFTIDGDFLYRPGGDNYWELGVEPWFPQPEWNEQGYTYHGIVRVKKPFVPFSPGKTIRREAEGDYNVVETSIDQPVMFVALLAGRYHIEEFEQKGMKVRVASYAIKNAQASKQLASIVFSAAEYYPLFLGPFPFTEMNVIEKNDLGYGQAPAATVFITREAFTPLDEEANDYVEGINMRIAHEVAHQYWGIVVKMPSPTEQWLTEAFSEYSAAMFMKAAGRKNDYDRALAMWRSDAKSALETSSIATANQLSNPSDPLGRALARQGLIYAKGAYLLSALHRELGDDAFLTFLKSYQKSFRWKFGTTEDVAGLLEYMTKKPYGPFFEQYFYGTAMPK